MRTLPGAPDAVSHVASDVAPERADERGSVPDALSASELPARPDGVDHRTGTVAAVLLVGVASPAAVTALWWSAVGWG